MLVSLLYYVGHQEHNAEKIGTLVPILHAQVLSTPFALTISLSLKHSAVPPR